MPGNHCPLTTWFSHKHPQYEERGKDPLCIISELVLNALFHQPTRLTDTQELTVGNKYFSWFLFLLVHLESVCYLHSMARCEMVCLAVLETVFNLCFL